MNAAAATLAKLWSQNRNFSHFDSPAFRPLRKAVGPFARKMSRDMFGGKGRSEYEEKSYSEGDARESGSAQSIRQGRLTNLPCVCENQNAI